MPNKSKYNSHNFEQKDVCPSLESILNYKDYHKEHPIKIDYALEEPYAFIRERKQKKNRLFAPLCGYLASLFAREEAQGTRFSCAIIFCLMGALLYYSLAFTPNFKQIGSLFLFLTVIYLFFGKIYFISLVGYFTCFFLLGITFAKFEDWRLSTPMLFQEATTIISGTVVEVKTNPAGKVSVIVDIIGSKNPVLTVPLKRVSLSISYKNVMPKIGNKIEGLAKLYPVTGPTQPQGYDFAFYNYFKGIGARGYFMSHITLSDGTADQNLRQKFFYKIEILRKQIDQKIKAILPPEEGAVASALITGKTEAIPQTLKQAYRLSGLAHILAISGLHMAMITGLSLVILRRLLSLYPRLACYCSTKKLTAFFAILVASGYLFLAGASVSVIRSYVMVVIMLLAIIFDRSAITMRNLALSMFVLLACWPHEVLSPTFQMSYAATAGLIAAFSLWNHYRDKVKIYEEQIIFVASDYLKKAFFPFITTIFISTIAGLATGIFSIYHFSNWAAFGVLSNLLALPVISILVMPFAFLSVFLMPFGWEFWPLKLMGVGLFLLKKIAFFVVGLSPTLSFTSYPAIAFLFFSFGLVFLCILISKLRIIGFFLFICGIILCLYTKTPILILSEDGKSYATFDSRQNLHLNRARISPFLLENWTQFFGAKGVIVPQKAIHKQAGFHYKSLGSEKLFIALEAPESWQYVPKTFLQKRGVLFLNYSLTDREVKALKRRFTHFLLITVRDLANKGTAVIYDDQTIQWAIEKPFRNWNRYRLYYSYNQEGLLTH